MKALLGVVVAVLFVIALTYPTVQAQVCGTITGANAPPGPSFDGYLAGTQKCSLGVTPFTLTSTCTDDGGIEATFSPDLSVRQAGVVGGGWFNWSSPPFSESPNPFVGFTGPFAVGASTATITMNGPPVSVFGFELQPNSFNVFSITATYRDSAGGTLFSITQMVNGNAGARLFAGSCNQPVIASVVITAPDGALGFAIGQLRSDGFLGFLASPAPAAPVIPAEVPTGATSNASERP